MGAALIDVAAAPWSRISAGDTVELAVVRPPNNHPASVETFWFPARDGVATSDGAEMPVRASPTGWTPTTWRWRRA